MRYEKLRIAVAAVIFLALSACLLFGVPVGTLCGFGWEGISALCPVGAVLAMVSAKTLVPQALMNVVVALVLVVLLGRAFCGWICPVTLWRRIKDFFKPAKKRRAEELATAERNKDIASFEISESQGHVCSACGVCESKRRGAADGKAAAGGKGGKLGEFDSRHAVLGGAIVASIFCGFPVFCLVCPVGLSFAIVALLIGLFGFGDLNWSLAFAPFFLVIELVFLQKWCTRFCPISALISLFGRFSKTGMPQIDNSKCLETSKGVACSQCATVCKYDVNLRHPEYGELPVYDCARCMECVDACPAQAISVKLVNGASEPFKVEVAANGCEPECDKTEHSVAESISTE